MTDTKSAEFGSRTIQPIFRRILVPIDKSGYKDKVIMEGVKLAKALGSEITAIHIIDESLMSHVTDTNNSMGEKGRNIKNLIVML